MRICLTLVLAACRTPLPAEAVDANFVAENDRDAGFTLYQPACHIVRLDADLTLAYGLASAEATLTVEGRDAEGRVTVIERRDLAGERSGTVTIPRQRLRLGPNRFVFWVHGKELYAKTAVLHVQAVNPESTGSFEDADGDCYSPRLGDCDDASPSIHPGREEVCGDRVDNDCDGLVDNCGQCVDSDEDGHPAAYCGGDDCDDGRAATSPTASEVCNSVDDDCDGLFDEMFDGDSDGFVACASDVTVVRRVDGTACPTGYATCADCVDGDASIMPGDAAGSCTP